MGKNQKDKQKQVDDMIREGASAELGKQIQGLEKTISDLKKKNAKLKKECAELSDGPGKDPKSGYELYLVITNKLAVMCRSGKKLLNKGDVVVGEKKDPKKGIFIVQPVRGWVKIVNKGKELAKPYRSEIGKTYLAYKDEAQKRKDEKK